MNNDVRQEPSCCLFQFEGELRTDHIDGLRDLITTSGDAAPRHVLVDCHRVRRFGDGAFEALEAFRLELAAAGGKLMVVGAGHPHGALDADASFEPIIGSVAML